MADYPGLSEWAQCNHKGPLRKRRWCGEGGVGDSERSWRDMLGCWLWRWRKEPQAKKCWQPEEAIKGKEIDSH